MRPHVAALYAFARFADDIADEGQASAADRQGRLRRWQQQLHDVVAALDPEPKGDDSAALILAAVGQSIRVLDLPIELFDDLVSAFSQDTTDVRYASWDEVLDYCRRSANPIGRLVLRIAGYRDEALDRSSDALCTALQLTNFWQDFGRDCRSGRLYVPSEVQQTCGAREQDLTGHRLSGEWANAIEACVSFTEERFERGRAVCDGVRGRLGLELRFTWLGGARVLERTRRQRFELLARRPVLGAIDAPLLLWRALRWPSRARR